MQKNIGRGCRSPCGSSRPTACKLAAFLTGAAGLHRADRPGLTRWESLTYNEQPYVKITPRTRAGRARGLAEHGHLLRGRRRLR